MRVVYISSTHFDDASFIGGTERYVLCLAEHVSSFADTTVVSFSSSRQSTTIGKVRLELYPARCFINDQFKDPFSLRYLESLVTSDVVHIHNLNVFVSDIGGLVGRLLGKGTVVTDHGAFRQGVVGRIIPGFQYYEKAIAQSSFAMSQFPQALQDRAIVVKGGVDTAKFAPPASAKREPKILFVGRIVQEKGIRYLIEAFRLLRRPEHKLVIIGRVYDQHYYKELIKLSDGLPVTFVHNADDDAILHAYQTATVMVLPSLFRELMGQVLLESQACGTPVICSDAGAMQEFVLHGETGFVVIRESAEAIAEALDRLINLSPAEQADRQVRCREWVRRFDWRHVAEKHLDIYHMLMNR